MSASSSASLARMSKHYYGLAREALQNGDAAGATEHADLMFKQYRMMHRTVRRIFELMLDAAIADLPRLEDKTCAYAEASAKRLIHLQAHGVSEIVQSALTAYGYPGRHHILLRMAQLSDLPRPLDPLYSNGTAMWLILADPDGDLHRGHAAFAAGETAEGLRLNAGPVRRLRGILSSLLEAVVAEFETAHAGHANEAAALIGAGAFSEALRVIEMHQATHRAPHDAMVDGIAEVLSYHYKAHGDERFYEVLRETGEEFREDFDAWAAMSPEGVLDMTVFMQLSHPETELEVQESDERYTVLQHCGTGGRLIAAGRFDGPDALARVETDGPASLGRAGMPTYCAHCAVWNTVLTAERHGSPVWAIEHPHNSSAVLHVYKDPSAIPEDYRRRISPTAPGPV